MTGLIAAVPLHASVEPARVRESFDHIVRALAALEPSLDIDTFAAHRGALSGGVRAARGALGCRFVASPESGDAVLYLGDGRVDDDTLRQVSGSGNYAALGGFYAVLVLEGPRQDEHAQARRCTLVRDRSGSMTMVYRVLDGVLLVAPRIIALHPVRPRLDDLDPLGLGFLLSSGYIPGAATQFSAIRTVEPGTFARFDGSGAPSVERYWRYPPSISGEAPDTADLLEQAVAAFDASVAANYNDPRHCAVFLSGGIDSRAIVAGCVAHAESAADVHTVSWGERESLAGSDSLVARDLSRVFGTRHQFLEKRCLDFGEDFATACITTDWLCDVPYMQPTEWRLMRALGESGYRSCLRGDQVFSGDRAVHLARDAQSMATLRRLSGQALARRMVRADVFQRWSDATEAFLHSLDTPEGYTPSDLRDLYRFEHQVANMHQVSALYKSLHMDHRNPIHDDHMLKLLPRTHANDRTGKRLFRQIEARVAAQAAAIPFAERHSDPDSGLFFLEGGLARTYLLESLDDASSPAFELFDREALLDIATNDLPKRTTSRAGHSVRKRMRRSAFGALYSASPQLASQLSHRSRASTLHWHQAIGRFLVIKQFMDSHFRS